jgi:hypothetical protein
MAKSRTSSRRHRRGLTEFIHEHALSLIVGGIVLTLLMLYRRADHSTHLGAFYGNAIADWLGTFVFVFATKYLFEIGSGESRRPPQIHQRVVRFLVCHSLTIGLVITGAAWIALFARSDVDSKWGSVVGNIVSEWGQVLGLVLITKYATEYKSKEGK